MDYSGVKTEICEIVDKYVEYILEIGSQTAVMEDIVSLVKINAKAYVNLLAGLFKDKSKLAIGMKRFVYEIAPDAKDACEKYNFSINTLFNMLSKALEEEKWQWRESEVSDATAKLKKKLFHYKYPEINYIWIGYSKIDGGYLEYKDIQKARNKRKKDKENN
jgi:hypothetical protein